jgi:hypothetical protein
LVCGIAHHEAFAHQDFEQAQHGGLVQARGQGDVGQARDAGVGQRPQDAAGPLDRRGRLGAAVGQHGSNGTRIGRPSVCLFVSINGTLIAASLEDARQHRSRKPGKVTASETF